MPESRLPAIKTLDDFADCATDDLCGWVERSKERGVEPTRHAGFLDGFDVGRQDAEEMILAARIILGWIKPEDLMEGIETDEDGNPIVADSDDAAGDGMAELPDASDSDQPDLTRSRTASSDERKTGSVWRSSITSSDWRRIMTRPDGSPWACPRWTD